MAYGPLQRPPPPPVSHELLQLSIPTYGILGCQNLSCPPPPAAADISLLQGATFALPGGGSDLVVFANDEIRAFLTGLSLFATSDTRNGGRLESRPPPPRPAPQKCSNLSFSNLGFRAKQLALQALKNFFLGIHHGA